MSVGTFEIFYLRINKSENKMYFIFFNKGDKQYDDFGEILYFKVIKVFFPFVRMPLVCSGSDK